jgi:hypothetical protein
MADFDLSSVVSPMQAAGLDPQDPRALALFKNLAGGGIGTPSADNPAVPSTSRVMPPPSGTAPAPSPTPAAPAAVSPSGQPTADYFKQGMEGQLRNARAAEKTVASMPTTDTASAALQDKYSKVATPTPLYDANGKMLSDYRPSVGQRILRGLRQGPLRADYSAPNSDYQHLEAARVGQEKGLGGQLAASRAAFKESSDRLTAISKEQRDASTSFNDVTKGATAEEAAQNKGEELTAKTALEMYKASGGGGSDNDFRAWHTAFARDNGREPTAAEINQRKINEALASRPPREGRAPSDLELWNQAFQSQYGRKPTSEELASRKVSGGGTAGGAAARPGPNHAKDPQTFNDHWDKNEFQPMERKYDAQRKSVEKDTDLNDTQKQVEYDRIEAERKVSKQDLQDKKDEQAEKYGVYNQPQTPAGPAPGAQPPRQGGNQQKPGVQPPPKPAQPAPNGRVWVYDKTTGALGHIPPSQVKIATQGQNARYSTF